ncbi:MAG TPA: hypothetical protein PLS90_04715 [Candidatus Sumerlaeota bacterium]|nr:MAG: hypothetical protein BWZ08_02382 [candidate division BRC1 bacterium ADurb.BinA292]HOE97450.1 hypothetical protein [Candidatus Sumerlaeota bacterium]HPK01740.1 hypothetical protein [Candidatus Sumerlaeota bacterium]
MESLFHPRLVLALALLLGGLAAGGCSRNKYQIEIDRRFSMNLVRVPDWYPPANQPLGPAEADVLQRMGKPDFFRLWWREDGSLITSSDLSGRIDQVPETLQVMQRSWLYPALEQEVLFLNDGQSYRVQPMSEVIKLVARYGDPSSRTPPVLRNGRMYETWQWIEYGLQIEMVDGLPGKVTHFPATGTGTYLGK